MSALLAHLIKSEALEKADDVEAQFKSNLYIADPERYQQVFGKDGDIANDDIDWIIPQNEAELRKLMEEARDAYQGGP